MLQLGQLVSGDLVSASSLARRSRSPMVIVSPPFSPAPVAYRTELSSCRAV